MTHCAFPRKASQPGAPMAEAASRHECAATPTGVRCEETLSRPAMFIGGGDRP
eukprot:CAMPEP_0182834080 /NCGR_PEP_ID=MMETSP0006_2-20121128/20705_1 /TAXON_ID=97485 /ORGANISM="Prymnesium parvum, Strain Texoma1" /LENGTH=52 /DNA_ID=CAMNT_0024962265 /DNA_START=77 /DNA_END=235 /DNA_ORIENTATION=+